MAGILVGLLASCERKDEQASKDSSPSPDPQRVAAVGTAEGKGEAGGTKPGKTAERPVLVKKKPPVAEPVADKPGFVVSPFSGKIIDVRGIPAGTLVADPMFPSEEKKHFRVPELSKEDQEIIARDTAPAGRPVPGKPGFIFSPYDNKVIDATGSTPGQVIVDPTAAPELVRYIKIPGETPKILDPTNLIDPEIKGNEEP